ncbi:hypothetical protein BDC45DRAFT_578104 [Circinella umbellata]|nr:hypothetical protein BDC45DRAFT_578104 [Circinella umbellata]
MPFNNNYRPGIISIGAFIRAIKHLHQILFLEFSQLNDQRQANMQITDVMDRYDAYDQYLYTSNYLQSIIHRTLQQQQQGLRLPYLQQDYGVTEEQRFNNKMNAILYYADYLQRIIVMDVKRGRLDLIDAEAIMYTVNYLRSMVDRYYEDRIMSTPRPRNRRQQRLTILIWELFQPQSLEHLHRIRQQEYYQQQTGPWFSFFI